MPRINKKGFTLLETLVAVALLTTAVASAIAIVSKSIQSATYTRDQMIASFLASEGIELVRAVRDDRATDVIAGTPSTEWLSDLRGGPCETSTCDIDPFIDPPSTAILDCGGGFCPLYIDGSGYYRSYAGGVSSKFSRKINITNISNTEAVVTVTVKAGNDELVIEENLMNWHAQTDITSQAPAAIP